MAGRYFTSVAVAIIVTLLLFLFMAWLIRPPKAPVDKLPEPEFVEAFASAAAAASQAVAKREVPKPQQVGGTPPPMPTINPVPKVEMADIKAMTAGTFSFAQPEVKLNVVIESPGRALASKAQNGRTGVGTIDGTDIELIAFTLNDDGKGKQCGMYFTLTPDSQLRDITWFNCQGNAVAAASEAALRDWLRRTPDAYDQLPEKDRHMVFFNFENETPLAIQ